MATGNFGIKSIRWVMIFWRTVSSKWCRRRKRERRNVSDTHQICLLCWVEWSWGNELIFTSCLFFSLSSTSHVFVLKNSNESHFKLNCSVQYVQVAVAGAVAVTVAAANVAVAALYWNYFLLYLFSFSFFSRCF